MNAWVKSGQKDAPQRVKGVIQWMKELMQEYSEIKSLRPDVVSLSTLAAARAKKASSNPHPKLKQFSRTWKTTD